MSHDYSENILVQESAGHLLERELGWEVVFAYNTERLGESGTLGRRSYHEILLTRYVKQALTRLNPWLTSAQLDEAQKKMGEASVLEMYLNALPEVVKNAAAPLAQTDKIVMYGDGNSTKLVKDVMQSASQIVDGVKESTGIDLQAVLAGFAGGKAAQAAAPAPQEDPDA